MKTIKYSPVIMFFYLVLLSNGLVAENPVSHEKWDAFLSKYVNAEGNVNYEAIKSNKTDLEQYLSVLSDAVPSETWGKKHLMAFWINAYNAFTIQLIVDHYPLESIMDLKFDGNSAWDYAFIKIGGNVYTLNQIEHEILRKQYFDPSIHFVVNCASFSCPRLLNKAYTAQNLESLFASMTEEFINNSVHNKIAKDKVEVSQLFNWYKDDFTKEGSVIDYLNQYSKININPDAALNFMEYDWSLNAQ